MGKYIKRFDARGIKIYPATGFYPNEERIKPFWDAVDDHGLVVLTHAGAAWGPLEEKYNRPSLFSEVLEKHQRHAPGHSSYGRQVPGRDVPVAGRARQRIHRHIRPSGLAAVQSRGGHIASAGGVAAYPRAGAVRLGLATVRPGVLACELGSIRQGTTLGRRQHEGTFVR